MSEVKYRGGCACGAVQLEITADPAGPYQCYCRQCQYVSGGSAAIFVTVPMEHLHIVRGQVVAHEQRTESGRKASRSFCSTCGTPVFSQPGSSPGMAALKLGALENPLWPSVRAIFWASEAPSWAILDSNAKRFETQ